MHKCLNEFKFLPDPTIDYGVICSWMSEQSTYNLVSTLEPSFLISSSSFLQVTRTTIKSKQSSNFDQILQQTAEFSCPWASGKIPINLQWEICCGHSSVFNSDWIFFIFEGNEDMHKCLNEFEFLLEINYRVICPWKSEKSTYNLVATLVPAFLIGSSSFLQVMMTTIKSLKSSNFGQIRKRTSLLFSIWKNLHRLTFGEMLCPLLSAFIFEWSILFLQVTRTTIKAWMSLNFRQIQQLIAELAALECLKIYISSFSRLLSIRSFLKLQITRECILSLIYYNFGQVEPQTSELVALEHLDIPL